MDFFRENLKFFRQNFSFLRNAKDSKFAVECNWIRKNLQKVRKFGVPLNKKKSSKSSKKKMGFWLTKSFFLKNNKSIKIAADCDWMSKTSQNFRKLGFFLEKNSWVSGKEIVFF